MTPYLTIDAAIAAMTASRNVVMIMPGAYTLSAEIAMPIFDCSVIGVGGGVEVEADSGADSAFAIEPVSLTGTTTYTFQNMYLDHGDVVGIQIDNASATKKIILALNNMEFGAGSGNSIDVDHGLNSEAVRIYCDNGGREIEGPVNFAVNNNGDRCRFDNASLMGGLVSSATATVAEFTLRNCVILHEGVTGGNGSQVMNVIACVSLTGATYAAVDTSDLAGSHTENIIAFN